MEEYRLIFQFFWIVGFVITNHLYMKDNDNKEQSYEMYKNELIIILINTVAWPYMLYRILRKK